VPQDVILLDLLVILVVSPRISHLLLLEFLDFFDLLALFLDEIDPGLVGNILLAEGFFHGKWDDFFWKGNKIIYY